MPQVSQTMDPQVKKFLDHLPLGKRRLAKAIRTIVLAVSPEIAEAIKWGSLTLVYHGKNLAFVYTYKRKPYLNLGFMQGVKLADPKGLFEGMGKGMRHQKIASEHDIDERQIEAWVTQAMAIDH